MIYLASPYTHPDPAVRVARFEAACLATVTLVRAGHAVFSPIVHSHALVAHGLPIEWDFWERLDREHLMHSDVVLVLMLDGWRVSAGVRNEIRLAAEFGLPVSYASLEELQPVGNRAGGRTCLAG